MESASNTRIRTRTHRSASSLGGLKSRGGNMPAVPRQRSLRTLGATPASPASSGFDRQLDNFAFASTGFGGSSTGRSSTQGGSVVGSGRPVPMDPVEQRVMAALAVKQHPEQHSVAARHAADEVLGKIFQESGPDGFPKATSPFRDAKPGLGPSVPQGPGNGTSGDLNETNLYAEMIRNSKLRRRRRALSLAYADIDRIDHGIEASSEFTQMFQDFMDAVDYLQAHDLPPDYKKYARLIYRNANAVVEYYLHDFEDWQICSAIYACSDDFFNTETMPGGTL